MPLLRNKIFFYTLLGYKNMHKNEDRKATSSFGLQYQTQNNLAELLILLRNRKVTGSNLSSDHG
jgi:hypothetical protein